MALTRQRRIELAAMMLPSDSDMQERVKTFLARSGLTQGEFAVQIGYAPASIGLFLNQRYGENHPSAENASAIKAACKAYMDRFDLQHDIRLRGTHYETADYVAVRAAAFKALDRGLAYIVDGPPGTQKTWSFLNIRREIQEAGAGDCIYVYCRVEHTKQSLLQEICVAAGIPSSGNIDKLLRKLQFFLGSKRRVLLMVDEGQHLTLPALEVLRQLLDLPPYFGVIIGGSHDLTQRLQHWQMEQWRQRNEKTLELRGPLRSEARKILAERLGISDKSAADEIIADCVAKATKFDGQRRRSYEYTSARLLFGFIEGVLSASPAKEIAA